MPCILVIEDDTLIRALWCQILARAGYDVVEARDGHEGLQVCQAYPVDLVLTDLMMPGLNGFATIRTLRARHPALKIILISGRDVRREPQMAHMLEHVEVARVLLKPVQREDLLAAVQEVLATGAP